MFWLNSLRRHLALTGGLLTVVLAAIAVTVTAGSPPAVSAPVVASTTTATSTTTLGTATTPTAALSAAVIGALDKTGVTVTPITAAQQTSLGPVITPQAAVATALAVLPAGSVASAASLVTLAGGPGLGGPTTYSAWAIEILPEGGYVIPSAGPPEFQARWNIDYQVDFVNALNDELIMSTEGSTAG